MSNIPPRTASGVLGVTVYPEGYAQQGETVIRPANWSLRWTGSQANPAPYTDPLGSGSTRIEEFTR